MSKKLLRVLLVFVVLLVMTFALLGYKHGKNPDINSYLGTTNTTNSMSTHPLIFFEAESFNKAVALSKNENRTSAYHISGGIIPHHLFPASIITDFFSSLAEQQPQTVILIGPNHYENGDFPALSSLYGWNTPFGTVQPNQDIIKQLVNKNLLRIEETVLTNEHSVAGIMPFIKFYLPDTQVVPIILSNFMTQTETDTLALQLQPYFGQNTVMITAVDFSHYLTSSEAQIKDEVTYNLLSNFDIPQLFLLNSDYLDSPASIAVLLKSMQMRQTRNMELLHHTNSGEMVKDNSIETTSYFSISYY